MPKFYYPGKQLLSHLKSLRAKRSNLSCSIAQGLLFSYDLRNDRLEGTLSEWVVAWQIVDLIQKIFYNTGALEFVLFYPPKRRLFMSTKDETIEKPLIDVLVGSVFMGGQLQIVSPQEPTHRGEIRKITMDRSSRLLVLLEWSARKYDAGWYKNPVIEYALRPSRCQCKEGVGVDAGTIELDCPHLRATMTFYPRGHRTNISQQDIKSWS